MKTKKEEKFKYVNLFRHGHKNYWEWHDCEETAKYHANNLNCDGHVFVVAGKIKVKQKD